MGTVKRMVLFNIWKLDGERARLCTCAAERTVIDCVYHEQRSCVGLNQVRLDSIFGKTFQLQDDLNTGTNSQ